MTTTVPTTPTPTTGGSSNSNKTTFKPRMPNELLDQAFGNLPFYQTFFKQLQRGYQEADVLPGFITVTRATGGDIADQLEFAKQARLPARALSFESMPYILDLQRIVNGLVSLQEDSSIPRITELVLWKDALDDKSQMLSEDTIFNLEEGDPLQNNPSYLRQQAAAAVTGLLARLSKQSGISRITIQASQNNMLTRHYLRFHLAPNGRHTYTFERQTIFLDETLKQTSTSTHHYMNLCLYKEAFRPLCPVPSRKTIIYTSFPEQMCQVRLASCAHWELKASLGDVLVMVDNYGDKSNKALTNEIKSHLKMFKEDHQHADSLKVKLCGSTTAKSDPTEEIKNWIMDGNQSAFNGSYTKHKYRKSTKGSWWSEQLNRVTGRQASETSVEDTAWNDLHPPPIGHHAVGGI